MQAQLKPRFQAKELDSDDCKWVLKKVMDKVMANTSAASGEEFLTKKRIVKVNTLIDQYAMQRRLNK